MPASMKWRHLGKISVPPLFNHSSNRFHIFYKNKYMRYNVCTNWEPPYAHKYPCSRRARTKLERVIAQIDRAVALKVRACEGTSEGSSAEVFMIEHALCCSNSSSEKSALAATPQIGGNLALDL